MQSFLHSFENFLKNYMSLVHLPDITPTDIVEMIIITFLIYSVMVWIKNTRAWMLFKGILVILGFTLIAAIFQMNTILWLAEKTISVGVIAVIIVFQPELRKALEQLGRKNFFSSFFTMDSQKNNSERYSERTVNELIKATFVEAFSCLSRRCKSGSENAAVLPVPVWAAPITSLPVNTTGMACAWMGVMLS